MSVKELKEQIAREFCDLICPDEYEICAKDDNFCGANLKRVEELLSLKSKDGLRLAIVKDSETLPENPYADLSNWKPKIYDEAQNGMVTEGFVKEVKEC